MGRNSHIPAGDTQRFIIERSSEVFNKKGSAGTSLADLEKATGLTKGSIYSNFNDKEEVVVRVFNYNYEQLKNELLSKIQLDSSPKEQLKASIDFYIDYFPTLMKRGGCPIQNSLIESDDTNPVLFSQARKALLAWKLRLQYIIAKGIELGEISNTVVPADFAAYMIALIEGTILISRSLNSESIHRIVLDKLREEIVNL